MVQTNIGYHGTTCVYQKKQGAWDLDPFLRCLALQSYGGFSEPKNYYGLILCETNTVRDINLRWLNGKEDLKLGNKC